MKTMFKKMSMLALIFVMVISMTACGASASGDSATDNNQPADSKEDATASQSLYTPGTYQASASGKNGDVTVEVVLTENEIQSVKVLSQNETEGVSDLAIEKLPQEIVESQSLALDSISGATLSSEAILAAVEACIVKAGGDVEALKVKADNQDSVETKELNYDIVVVGAGAAGTAAALAASEHDLKVLLVEKTAEPLGAGTLAGGLFAAESDLQKQAGKTVSKEWLYDEYMKSSSGYMNSILVKTIIDESSETVNWLIENGCKLNLVDAGTGASFEHIGMPATLHGYAEGGKKAILALLDSYQNNGGELMYQTPATDLIFDDEGHVSGIMAKNADGDVLKIHAKEVILATGGFGGNEEMLKTYLGNNYTFGEIASNKGDGIKMAWSAGADELGIHTTQYFWETFLPKDTAVLANALGGEFFSLHDFTFYPHLRVNQFGQRFCNETTASNFAIHGAQVSMQPEQVEYLILDDSVLNQIATEGYASVEEHYGKWKNNRQFYMEFNEPNDTDTLIEQENTPRDYRPLLDGALDSAVVFKADTLEELAQKMGTDFDTFKASVDQYNNAIKAGEDDLFYADTNRLVSVEKGPYYAIKYHARNLTTLGGVKINEKIQAVDEHSQPIEGLYVAGADAGGMYGVSYVDFEGGTLGFAYTSGRLAGSNAATEIEAHNEGTDK